jgi:hypothetical protein
MSNFSKAMFFRHNLRPLLDRTALNFNGISTAFADQMMMVSLSTEAVDRLTIITS